MAHFAQLDESNKVLQVIVVANQDTMDEAGQESEQVGIQFCKSLLGDDTNWVQTSYNGKFRGKYAAVGDMYSSEEDIFIDLNPVVQIEAPPKPELPTENIVAPNKTS
jgi:hypothetical protein